MLGKMLISNVRVIDPASAFDSVTNLLITDGKITAIGSGFEADKDTTVIDGTNLMAAPGFIDMHVHLREPGQTEKEDIASGCMAAAAGGITSLVCMPNTKPTTDSPEAVNFIKEKAAAACGVKVYPAAAITKNLAGEVQSDFCALKAAGVIAVSDDGNPVADDRILRKAMIQADKQGLKMLCHCENKVLSSGGLINEGKISEVLGIPGMPAEAEDSDTARVIEMAESTGCAVHICHVSTRGSVKLIREAKKRGVKVTAETAPHYFAFTESKLLKEDADFRMNPPLRTYKDRFAVIEGLCDGTIDAIATDHAPHTPEEKADFLSAPNGVIGMETSFAASFMYLKEFMTLSDIIACMTVKPANILGLDAGRLQVGAPADIVLFNPRDVWTVKPEELHGKSRNAVFKGQKLIGRVYYTICDGNIIFERKKSR
ncbi:MAG: dihydroorotase [Clostridia bacterium]|nr:dihydroorotase [Clostridia bacterium]